MAKSSEPANANVWASGVVPMAGGRTGTSGGATALTPEVVGQMIDAYRANEKALRDGKVSHLGLPLAQFCERLGVEVPSNLNSFKAGLQRAADETNVDGFTVVVSYKGAEAGTFHPLPTSTMRWRVVTVEGRKKALADGKARREARQAAADARAAAAAAEAAANGGADDDEDESS